MLKFKALMPNIFDVYVYIFSFTLISTFVSENLFSKNLFVSLWEVGSLHPLLTAALIVEIFRTIWMLICWQLKIDRKKSMNFQFTCFDIQPHERSLFYYRLDDLLF